MSMQALFPVQLQRHGENETDTQAYNRAVSINEDNLNQNLDILFQAVASLNEKITAMETMIAKLQGGDKNGRV